MSLLLDPEAQPVVAHRGNSAFAPENTLEALAQGVRLGADALEFDVRASRDGHVVAMHDPGVTRTTNGMEGVSHGQLVAALTLAELRTLDAGFRFSRDDGRTFPWRSRGVQVPTLDEVLDAFPAIPMIIEIKSPDAAAMVERALRHHGATRRVVLGSFSHAALARFRGGDIAHGASRRDVVRLYARAVFPGGPRRVPWQVLCVPPVSGILPLPVLRFARMLRPLRVPTHVWTVDDPREARELWSGGVNAIISNDPAAILAAAGRAVPAPTLSPAMAS